MTRRRPVIRERRKIAQKKNRTVRTTSGMNRRPKIVKIQAFAGFTIVDT